MSAEGSEKGCTLGCFPFVLSCLVLWALIFGVTVGDKHYDLSCSCNHGVNVETTRRTK